MLVGVGAGPGLNDSTLLRWLRAEKYDVDKAYNRLVKHAQWRADYVPDGRIHEVPPPSFSLPHFKPTCELELHAVHQHDRRAETCV